MRRPAKAGAKATEPSGRMHARAWTVYRSCVRVGGGRGLRGRQCESSLPFCRQSAVRAKLKCPVVARGVGRSVAVAPCKGDSLARSLLKKSAGSPDPPYRRSKTLEMTEIRPPRGATAHVRILVVIRIVSCDLDHIAAGTQPIHFSRTFVGTQRRTAEQRCLSCYPGRPDGIDADQCLFQILSFLR